MGCSDFDVSNGGSGHHCAASCKRDHDYECPGFRAILGQPPVVVLHVLGSALCFILSRTLGKKFALRIVGKSLESAEHFFKKYGLQSVFIVRIMPFVPFDAVSYGAGLVGGPFSKFILATAIGIIPSILVYSYVGTMVPVLTGG